MMVKKTPPSGEGGNDNDKPSALGVNHGSFKLTQTVGERIKWARERSGLTQKELGEKSNKSRSSIVQYEQGRIEAPVNVLEDLASVLDVSPEYLAFGRTGIAGIHNAQEEILVLEEIAYGKDGAGNSGGWALPKAIFAEYPQLAGLKVVSLQTDEPHFNLKKADRVIVDEKAALSKDGLYVIVSPFGARVVRIRLGYTTSTGVKLVSGLDGTEEEVDPAKLDVVGCVVSIFCRQF